MLRIQNNQTENKAFDSMTNRLLRPKSRQLLKKLFDTYGRNIFSYPHSVIADSCGMKTSTVTKHLKLLVEARLLNKQESGEIFKGKGWSKFRYQISDTGLERLDEFNYQKSVHHELITQIQDQNFCERLKKSYEGTLTSAESEHYQINTDDCVLLMTALLIYADEHGNILGITRQKLSKMVGFNNAKIKRLTKALVSLKLIIQFTPGLSGFLGVQPCIYRVSLQHPLYKTDDKGKHYLNAEIEVRFGPYTAPPAISLLKGVNYLRMHNIDKSKGPVDIIGLNEKEQKDASSLDKIKVHLNASDFKVATYYNALMTAYTAKTLNENPVFKDFSNRLGADADNIKAKIFQQFKDMIGPYVLPSSISIEDSERIAEITFDKFLQNTLQIGMILEAMKWTKFKEVRLANSHIIKAYPPQLQLLVICKVDKPLENDENRSFGAILKQDRKTQNIEVELYPNT